MAGEKKMVGVGIVGCIRRIKNSVMLNKEKNAEECDANEVEQRNIVGNKKIKLQ